MRHNNFALSISLLPALALSATSAIAQEAASPPAADTARVDLSAAAENSPTRPDQSQYTNADTTWWTFGAGASTDFDELSDINATASFEYFVDCRVSVVAELAVRDFDMPGDDVQGINPAIVFRWHFWTSDNNDWTAFVDMGIGILLTTDDVPQDGTSINFTPRAGFGITKAISDSWRIQAGARWSHISNGRIFGDDDNPASDGIMLFVGFTTNF